MLFSIKVFSFALYELKISTSQITQASVWVAQAMVTDFTPLERNQSSSNLCEFLFLLIALIHLFKARLRQPGFF